MLSRRSFAKMFAALPFVGGVAKVPEPVKREPRIVLARPEQKGLAGVTYFEAGSPCFYERGNVADRLNSQALRVHGFAGDGDIRCVVTEVDLAGGWVGVLAHHFTPDGTLELDDFGSSGPFRYWVTGDVVSGGPPETLKQYPGAKVWENPRRFPQPGDKFPDEKLGEMVSDKVEAKPFIDAEGRPALRITRHYAEGPDQLERSIEELSAEISNTFPG